MTCDLSVVIPARHEAENLRLLLPGLQRIVRELGVSAEILVVDGGSEDGTPHVVEEAGARLIRQSRPGYGQALREGFGAARGRWLLTMDADLSHEPGFIAKLWTNREMADLLIASRYVRGGIAYMPLARKLLSRILNRVLTLGLSLDVRDVSSGFRLYRASTLQELHVEGADFDVLPEIVVRCQAAGWRIREVPFTYFPRHQGRSQASIVRVGLHVAKTFVTMWRLRNSPEAADYDERAFYSWRPLQRVWQRRRHQLITRMARGCGRTLNVGCGSSVILQSLNWAIGMDIRHAKMRYMKRYGMPVTTGSLLAIPFRDGSMDCVICAEVREGLPSNPAIFAELDRVLKPGGVLVLGTPDSTRSDIQRLLQARGYQIQEMRHVVDSGLMVSARKSAHQRAGTTERPLGICMLSSKFYASSDMGGGLERSARRLITVLSEVGHQVFVLTRNYDGLRRREEIDGARVERFPLWGRSKILVSLSYLVQSLWWLVRHRREYHIIHCHQSSAPALIGGVAKLLLKKPVVVKVSTADVFSERKELERLPLFPLRRFLLRRIDRLIVVNPSALEEFGDLGIPPSKMIHIPNGVPVPPQPAYLPEVNAEARRRLALPEGKLAVFVGRLSSEKNLHVLLASWPMVLQRDPAATLVLVGDGGTFRSVEASLREQVRGLGLEDRIRFAGRVSDVTDFLLAADAFVLPSKTEGMSNALLEAMAHGLPVIATRVPGNVRLIRHEENGLLVEPDDPLALAAAIVRIFDTPADAQRMAHAARQTVNERFTIQQVGEAYRGVYAELLTKAGNG